MNTHETILLVDDHQDNLIVMKKVLQKALPRVEIATFQKPEEVMDYVRTADVSVAIFDVQMPIMNGVELCEKMKASEETRHIPVILVTSHDASSGFKAKGLDVGADDFLTRPIDNDELVARVKVALRINRAEAQLRRTVDQVQQDYKLLFETEPECVKIVSPEGVLLNMNPAGLKMLEAESLAQARSQPLIEFVVPEFQAAFRGLLGQVIQGQSRVIEFECIGLKGGRCWLESHAVPLWDAETSRTNLLSVTRDITERKQSEIALAESEKKIRTWLENSPVCTKILDLDFNLQYMSTAGVAGLKVDDVTQLYGKPYPFSFFPDSFNKQMLSKLEKAKATGETITHEGAVVDLEGNEIWFHATIVPVKNEQGQLEYLMIISVNITERKRAEAEKERLMAAINQVAEVILITDAEGTIQYVNPAFEAVTGYCSEEAMGQNPRLLKSDEQDAAFYKELWDTLAAGGIWKGRLVNKKKDGTLYTEETMISPVKDADGTVVNYVAVKRDVTEEIKLEEQARQSQKMESIGQLVGGVAHDFNNLLQIINGYTDMARSRLEPQHVAAASLEEVSKAGGRARDLVGQLLAFSRQQVIDPADLDLNMEIESSQKMLRHIIGEHIQFQFIAGEDLGLVFADKGQINQVMMNLCVNARDAMPDGGTLTLKTESVLIAPEDLKAHGLVRPGRYVFLSITDTGCGMDKTICEKIFDPFFTTKEVGKGTGLGLSTVYGIVKQNEGHIAVYSELGEGTVFKIYLPVASPLPAGGFSPASENDVPAEGGAETILVTEDDEAILKLATQILSSAGYTVLTAKDGEEAVRVFKEHADEIDLVMMDVVMPRMSGKNVMDAILQKRPAMRHLFVSGYSPDAGHNDFIKEKGLHLLSKPYQAAALLHKIREVLEV